MYWLYFDLREQLSDHRKASEQGESIFFILSFATKHIGLLTYFFVMMTSFVLLKYLVFDHFFCVS